MTTETESKAPNRADRRAKAAAARKEKAPEAPAIQPRRTYVVFVHDDDEGFERHDRMWVDVPDLRTVEQVLGVEQVIAEQKKLANVRIINWRALEG